METQFELTPTDAALLRSDLEEQVAKLKREHSMLRIERRSLERMVRTQKHKAFRAAKYRAKFKVEGRSVEVDAADGMLQRIIQRLGEIETRMETIEYQVPDAEEELAHLPLAEEQEEVADGTLE